MRYGENPVEQIPNCNSAFVCALDRSGSDLPTGLLDRLVESLGSYGAATSSVQHGAVGVAIRHAGGSGSLSSFHTGSFLAMTGRVHAVDSRSRLQQRSDVRPEASHPTSWVMDGFLQEGAEFLARVAGPFVFIAADACENRLTLARDHLGQVKVYYYLDHRWVIAASEPLAILRHPAVAADIDEHSVARFLGFQFSHSERSFFRHIKELPPAHTLQVTQQAADTRQYWSFRVDNGARRRSREHALLDFRGLLARSIENDAAGFHPDQVGLSLSGGLDSTALAALAPHKPRAFSWYFGDDRDRSERRNIESLSDHLRLAVHWVKGDGTYPLSGDYVDRFVHKNSPYCNAFAALKDRLYRTASEQGCRLMMVGDAGDVLYGAKEYWLRDLMMHGCLRAFLDSARRTVDKAWQGDGFALHSLRRLLPIRGARELFHQPRLPWLTQTARAYLPVKRFSPIVPKGRRKHRFDLSVGTKYTEVESEERRLFAQCGIERSNPFSYWPLLEAMLNLPAYWYHRDGQSKVLAREAMKGLLPDQVLSCARVGSLGWFFLRGMELNRDSVRANVFEHPRSDWQRYVNRAWVEPYLTASGGIAFGHTILWRIISYELWYRRLIH